MLTGCDLAAYNVVVMLIDVLQIMLQVSWTKTPVQRPLDCLRQCTLIGVNLVLADREHTETQPKTDIQICKRSCARREWLLLNMMPSSWQRLAAFLHLHVRSWTLCTMCIRGQHIHAD